MPMRASALSNRQLLFTLALLFVPFSCSPEPGAGLPPAANPLESRIDKFIRDLASDDKPTWKAADAELRKIGWSAMSSLIIARNSAGRISRERIEAIMQDLCWDTAGLDAKSTKLVTDYRAAPPERAMYFTIDIDHDLGASRIVGRARAILGPRAPGPHISSQTDTLSRLRHYADLKRAGEWAQLEWELVAAGQASDLVYILRKRPGDASRMTAAIQVLKKASTSKESPADVLTVEITRAIGKESEAFALASTPELRHYREQILAEHEDWTALSKFPIEHDFFNVSRFIPASALLFTGRIADADNIIDINSKAADGVEPVGLQRQVVLLGRINLINKACVQRGDSDTLVEFLLRERRYTEAFTHHSKPGTPRTGKDAWPGGTISAGGTIALGPAAAMDAQLDSRLLMALIKLNDIEKAREEIKRLDVAGAAPGTLNEADRLLGNQDAAFARAEKIPVDGHTPLFVITGLLEKDDQILIPFCELYWRESKDLGLTLRKVAQLSHGQLPVEEVFRLLDLARKPPSNSDSYTYARYATTNAISVFDKLGRDDLASDCLKRHLDSLPVPLPEREFSESPYLLKQLLGLRNQKLTQQFLDAMTARPDCDPGIQFIAGVLKGRAGDAFGAAKLRDEAELLLGGDVNRRLFLMNTLRDIGETPLAREQAEVITQIDEPVSTPRFDAHELLAHIDQEQGNFAAALQHYRLAFYAEMYDSIHIPEPYDRYFKLPRESAYCESRVALDKADRPTAIRAATDVILLDPEGVELTAQLINAFKDHKLPDQAQSLATRNRQFLEQILKDFPNSHLHHFLIAKLDALTGFTNDQTSQHLTRARQLAPNNTEYQSLQLPK